MKKIESRHYIVILLIIFTSIIVGSIVYFNKKIKKLDYKVESLNKELSNNNSQIEKQVANINTKSDNYSEKIDTLATDVIQLKNDLQLNNKKFQELQNSDIQGNILLITLINYERIKLKINSGNCFSEELSTLKAILHNKAEVQKNIARIEQIGCQKIAELIAISHEIMNKYIYQDCKSGQFNTLLRSIDYKFHKSFQMKLFGKIFNKKYAKPIIINEFITMIQHKSFNKNKIREKINEMMSNGVDSYLLSKIDNWFSFDDISDELMRNIELLIYEWK